MGGPGVFYKKYASLLDKIRDCGAEKLDDYRVIVHGIKSACRGIGADALGARAESLEHAARDGDFELVGRTNAGFIKEMEKLTAGLSAIREKRAGEDAKPLRTEPDRGDLRTLMEASGAYDVDSVDRTLEALEAYRYESGGELVSWLREQVNRSEFGDIVDRLTKELG